MGLKVSKMKKNYILFLSVILLAFTANAQEEVRDPFTPFVWDKPTIVSPAAELDKLASTPLTEKPLVSYRLVGLIVSPKDSIALVKSRDKREYFVSVGDQIGNEGGVIEAIYSDGMTIDINGRIIDLTVNNRFDIQDEIE